MLLRVAFLSKHMAKYMWVSIAMVVIGIGLIGMTDFLPMFSPPGFDKYGIAAGILYYKFLFIDWFYYDDDDDDDDD